MLHINAKAETEARIAAKKGNSYYYSSDSHYQPLLLSREMENCFRCGNWISTVVMAAAIIETFLHGYIGKGSKTESFLNQINFPEKDLYKKIIDSRNSIMHLRNKTYSTSFHKTTPSEMFELAQSSIWLSYFLVDYVLYVKNSS